MQLGGSSRVYRLHWVPISYAYDFENRFVPTLGDSEPEESTQEEQHQDESDFSLQNDKTQKEDYDMVQGLDSSFSGMSLFPRMRCLTPPAPPMLEQMSSPFPDKYEATNQNPPGNINEEGENSLLQPAPQPDKENSAPKALLVSGQFPKENADGTLPLSQQRCSNIWFSSVQIQTVTGRYRTMSEKVDMETEVKLLNCEIAGTESVSKDLFASGNKDKEDDEVFTPDKENHTHSSLFLGSMKTSRLSEMTTGSYRKSVLFKMDDTNEEIFTPDKENMTPDTRQLRLMKKMGSQHQIKLPNTLKSSSLKLVVKPKFNQSIGCVSQKKEKLGSTTKSTQSNMDENDDEIFTPDKENMIPGTRLMRSVKKIGKLEDQKHLEAFKFSLDNVVDPMFHQNGTPFSSEKDNNQTDKILEEQKSTNLASTNPARSKVNTVKNMPLQSISPAEDIKLRVKHPETKENECVMEQKRWTIVVDTGSLLNKESRKSLQLLQGLRGTYLIIPRTVIRELDCMKRRPRLFRRRTEVSEALEWIEDCMLKAKSWIHVQSCAEETRAVAPTPPATAPFSLFSEENGMFPVGSLQFSPHIASPTAEDHILKYALFFKRSNRNGQLVLLSDDLPMKIKAMAEGLNCETAEEFRESLVNPFSERFLWKDSSPRGRTWSCEDDFVLRETYYHHSPPKKPSTTGEAAKGLKLILLHNSHYRRHISSAS
ncbi:FHA domain-containing protein PS1 [Capsicum chacoense]